MKYREEGFTLIEVILVLTIVGILLAVAVPKFINLVDTHVEAARCAGSRGAINSAISVTYAAILVSNPTSEGWLQTVTYASLNDTMFATGRIPVCPQGGIFSIVNGQSVCSIHGQ